MEELGAPVAVVTCDIRDADQIAAMFDAAESAFHLPDVLDQQRGGELPGAVARTCRRTRGAASSTSR